MIKGALRRFKVCWGRLWSTPGVRSAAIIFITMRVGLLLFAPLARMVYPGTFAPHPIIRPYLGVAPATNLWLEPWQRWDTLHFQVIAERGYGAYDTSLFSPFLYPWLMGMVAKLFGGDTLLAGLIVSNLAYLVALAYLYRLTAMETDQQVARRCILYLASFPTAIFFLAAYSESLFLLTTVAALYYARQRRWLAAGAWAFFAPLARLQGAILPVVLGFEAWRARRDARFPTLQAVIGLTLSVLGVIAFPLYVWLVLGKMPWEPLLVQSSRFRGSFTLPGLAIVEAVKTIFSGEPVMMDHFDLGFTLLFILLTVLIVRRLPAVYGLYIVLMLMAILIKVGEIQPLMSVPRYVLAIFPAFNVLGQAGKNQWANRLILYLSWLGLLYFCGQFVIWGWVA